MLEYRPMVEIFHRRFYCVRGVFASLVVISLPVLETFDDSDVQRGAVSLKVYLLTALLVPHFAMKGRRALKLFELALSSAHNMSRVAEGGVAVFVLLEIFGPDFR